MRRWIKPLTLLLVVAISNAQCPDGTTGYLCTACSDSNCKTCNTVVTTCEACNDKYYLDGSGACTQCPTKCLLCDTNTYCSKCTPGYERTYDDAGNQICVFYWWKWFLIVFGTLIGIALIGVLIWWVRNKLKNDEGEREVQYEMKGKLQNTQNTIKE